MKKCEEPKVHVIEMHMLRMMCGVCNVTKMDRSRKKKGTLKSKKKEEKNIN